MTKRGTLFLGLGASALLGAFIYLPVGCSSSSDSNGSGGSAGSSGATAAGGSRSAGTGGSVGTGGSTAGGGSTAAGGSSGSTAAGGSSGSSGSGTSGGLGTDPNAALGVCPGDTSPNADYVSVSTAMCDSTNHKCCNSTDAKTGAFCTQNCCLGCGFLYNGVQMGTKTCSCPPGGGVYAQCPCPKPDQYLGAATAPACSTKGSITGAATELKDKPCDKLWDECVGNETPSGTTYQGCVCVPNAKLDGGTLGWDCRSTNKWFGPAL